MAKFAWRKYLAAAAGLAIAVAAGGFPGVWRVRAGTRTDATADSIAIILEQLRRLCEEPIPAAELEAGKRAVVGNFALNLNSRRRC